MRKDSILQQYYYKKLPKAVGGLEVDPEKPYSKTNPKGYVSMKNNQDWFDNHANWTNTGNSQWDAKVRQLVLTGRFGVNPTTGALIKLPKSEWSNVSDEYKEMASPEWGKKTMQERFNSKTAAGSAMRKREVVKSTQEAFKNPIMYAPAAIAAAPFIAGAATAAAPSVAAGLSAPFTVGSTVFPSVTAGKLLGAGFAADALLNRLPQVPGQISKGNYAGAAENILTGGLDLAGANMVAPIYKGASNLVFKGKNLYNTIAKGESILPVAWKSPAVGLSEEASQNMFKKILNSANLTDAERAVIADYQHNSRLYTGRDGNVDPVKRKAINDIIQKYNINVGDDVIATRMFNPENNSLGATLDKGRLNFGDRPTSFTVGAKGTYGSGAVDRLVIPNRYLKGLGNKFVKNTYEPLSEEALKLVPENSRKFAAGIGRNNQRINQERELIGSGLDFKRIGKVKNDVGGYDWIVKPNALRGLPQPKQSGFSFGNLKEMVTNPKQYFTKPGQPIITEGKTVFNFQPTRPQVFTDPRFRNIQSIFDFGEGEYDIWRAHTDTRLKNLADRGQLYDKTGLAESNWLNPETVHYHGTHAGRPIVEVKMPNGNSEYFYKSSGWAGKEGAGANNTTEGMWQVYDQHGLNFDPKQNYEAVHGWFGKNTGYKDWYGSNTFRNFAGQMDKTIAEKLGVSADKVDQAIKFFPEQRNPMINTFTPEYAKRFGVNDIVPNIKGDWVTQQIVTPGPRQIDWGKVGKTAAGVGIGTGLLSAGLKKEKYGGLVKARVGLEVDPGKPYHPITNPDGYKTFITDEQKRQMGLPVAQRSIMYSKPIINIPRSKEQAEGYKARQNASVGPSRTNYTRAQVEAMNAEEARRKAQANSALAQTMGSMTPQRYEDYTAPGGAGSIGAATQTITTGAPVLAAGVAGAAPSVVGGLSAPILGTPGLTVANLIGLGFGLAGANQLAKDINSGYYNDPNISTLGKIDRGVMTGLDVAISPGFLKSLGSLGANAINKFKRLQAYSKPPTPSSTISITRGPINWYDEPGYVQFVNEYHPGKTPKEIAERYVNSVGKFGIKSGREFPELTPTERIDWKGINNSAIVEWFHNRSKFNPVDISKNLEDLQEARKFAKTYGYDLPENIRRIAKSNTLTDRTIRGLMDRHNTFVRGVSTNWEEIGKRNPEILRHLEGKGFDLSTKDGSKAAAEYMATHIPISTGYGRASLDKEVFNKGLEGLYTSNSIPTAEGYTYGQGYVVKGKRPTDFSSTNRQDWITKNNPSYTDEDLYRKQNFFRTGESEDIVNAVFKSSNPKYATTEQKVQEVIKRFNRLTKDLDLSNPISASYAENIAADLENVKKYKDILGKSKYENKLLRTERSDLPTDAYDFLIKKEGNAKKLSEWLKTQPYQEKMREVNDLGESLRKYTWDEQKPIRDKIDILSKEAKKLYNESVQEYMKVNHPDYDPVNKYAHYIHLGTPGQKMLEPIKSWEITPEIWKNKSRAHTNTYTKKLSALEKGGVIKDDRGQWAHPGKITEISSPNITMQGVPYPVLGIGKDGQQIMMQPGQEYRFNKAPVTEIPMAQGGKEVAPIYTDDPNDPRLNAYNDSLNLYRVGEAELKRFYDGDPGQSYGKIKNLQDLNKATKNYSGEIPKNQLYNTNRDLLLNSKGNVSKISSIYNRTGILPTEFWASQGSLNYRFKKPVQPVIFRPNRTVPKGWIPLTPQLAKGLYSGDIKDMYYNPTGNNMGGPAITYIPSPVKQPEKKFKPQRTNYRPETIKPTLPEPSLIRINPIARAPQAQMEVPDWQYRVEYTDPETGQRAHRMFNTEEEGTSFGNLIGGERISNWERQPKKAYGGPLVDYYRGKMTGPNMFAYGGSVNPRQPLSLDAVIKQNRKDRDNNSYSGGISKFAYGGLVKADDGLQVNPCPEGYKPDGRGGCIPDLNYFGPSRNAAFSTGISNKLLIPSEKLEEAVLLNKIKTNQKNYKKQFDPNNIKIKTTGEFPNYNTKIDPNSEDLRKYYNIGVPKKANTRDSMRYVNAIDLLNMAGNPYVVVDDEENLAPTFPKGYTEEQKRISELKQKGKYRDVGERSIYRTLPPNVFDANGVMGLESFNSEYPFSYNLFTDKRDNFLAEVSHALQHNNTKKDWSNWHSLSNKLVRNHPSKYEYDTPYTIEHDAHEILQPILQDYENKAVEKMMDRRKKGLKWFQGGGLTFLEPNNPKLPLVGGRSEMATSIGGENGDPAYLIPSFKYGEPILGPSNSPLAEFRRTGEHLGGPFKTWQEADEWDRTVRHPYVEKGQSIPTPIRTWGEGYEKGGQANRFYYNKGYGVPMFQDGAEYKGLSIVDYLATKGYSGKKAFRKELAQKYNVEDYDFSAKKNLELLNKLRENDDLLEEIKPSFKPVSVERMEEMEKASRNVSNTPKVLPNKKRQPKVVIQPDQVPVAPIIPSPAVIAPPSGRDSGFRGMNMDMQNPAPVLPQIAGLPFRVNIPAPVPARGQGFNFAQYPTQGSIKQSIPQGIPVLNTSSPIVKKVPIASSAPAPQKSFRPRDTNKILSENAFFQNMRPGVARPKPSQIQEQKSSNNLYNWFTNKLEKTWKIGSPTLGAAPPEGAIQMAGNVSDALYSNIIQPIAERISPEKARNLSSYKHRQRLKNDDNLKETHANFKISDDLSDAASKSAMIVGDTIPLSYNPKDISSIKDRYIIPGQIDLNETEWGVRNRGDYRPIETQGADITLFTDFVPAKTYFDNNKYAKETASFIGIDDKGKVRVGTKKDFINTNYLISRTTSNKIVDFNRDENGKLILHQADSKASARHLVPTTTTLTDDGRLVKGGINFLVPKGNKDTKSFGEITGGRIIFQSPDGKDTRLAMGSPENIAEIFYDMKKKGNYPYITAFTNDNGTYAPGLRKKNGVITTEDLKKYQGANTTGSVFLYLKGNPNAAKKTDEGTKTILKYKDVKGYTPNIRTEKDESYLKGHPLENEQKAIVLHHTGYSDTTGMYKGQSNAMKGVINQFGNVGESSHVVIDFDGTRYNFARPDQVTFHAGKSLFKGRENVNDFGLGVEFQGDTDKKPLTDAQIESFVEYIAPIIRSKKIPLENIITHKQIRKDYMTAHPGEKNVYPKPDVSERDYKRIIEALKKKGVYTEIKKYGGDISLPQLPQKGGPLLQYYYNNI